MVPVSPRRKHACFAMAALLAQPAALAAQAPSPAQKPASTGVPEPVAPAPVELLDPNSPLAPMADLGVAWPDLAVSDPAEAGAAATTGRGAGVVDAAAEQRYRIVLDGLNGVGDARLRPRFDIASALVQGSGSPANVAQIERRAREDEGVLAELLRSYGYYDAEVDARVEADPATRRVVVTLTADPGALYRFADVTLPGLSAAAGKAPALADAYGVTKNQPVDAEKVLAAGDALKTALGRQGFAFGTVAEPEVVINHDTRTATLAIAVNPGVAQRFGMIRVEGSPLFSAKHLGRIARFRPGQPYDAALLEDYRRALIQTGLVSTLKAVPVAGADVGTVDIATTLEPAPPRTIAGTAGYGTGEGISTEVSWTHRNLIAPEGAVTVRGVLGTREQQAGVSLRRNNFKARDRVLTANVTAANINRNAYDARTFQLSGGLERQSNIIWQKTWTWSVGAELLASDERDTIVATGQARRRTFLIAALPGTLGYDGSDDLLNPTRGFRLSGRLSPELSLQSGTFSYARTQMDGSAYLPVTKAVTIAGRTRLGTIVGAERDSIAPSRRFYAGGGASIRGYGYQAVGPVDIDGDPIGGRSLTEFSIEARVRVGDFGIVPFLDAGNLYTSPLPRFTALRFGTGIGARYYTNFGPIRVDVGTPLNRRRGDARVAVYVSLGQAF
ncbi:autotransporter assembly complex protein TamA [Sphingomonas prati]|uniref:Translocation and assembly module TamA n=1 Tax=Sphingomonas prati TaxID=1843237 RepID=A0A7W9BU95_9SPHN|nr:BamA/TamA family outer membrane protein [Sphingomonas prati]MBB5730120.1 translocation and assembly module TamA [Sphingomonas prati]GGE91639.1 outer membrane protein assembly factor [Sphingomonas prati]